MNEIVRFIGNIPYRLVLAGGWIDQPFVNQLNPEPPGAMVVVSLEPEFRWMERSGMATSTRNEARRIWGDVLPNRGPAELVRELYESENEGRAAPSGSQDMAGMIYPGISRLDYKCGDVYPDVRSTTDVETCNWLESALWIVPVCPRPYGYDPLRQKNLEPDAIAALGQTGHECWEAIQDQDVWRLGSAMKGYHVWASAILPGHHEHPSLTVDLRALWKAYTAMYPGAVYSGCGGGYLIVANEHAVPGAFQLKIRRT